MKSSKQKQKIYNKFLKSRTKKIEVIYKAYKNLVEAIRKNWKEPVILNYSQNIKKI